MSKSPRVAALLLCALFVVIGAPWIDKPGIQTDEALFASAIYPPFDARFLINIFGHEFPMMVMTYVGALKALVWAMIFAVWPPSPASVRIPAVLLGALSIWWVYRLMSLTLGTRAALAGASLLATNPIYVLCSRMDYGPVVIQHLCLVGAMLALVRFHQERRRVWLAAGFFAFGLGMWEKAVFTWLLSGLAIAALVLFRRQIRSALTFRNLAVATASFALGALPLIVYNASNALITFRERTVWSTNLFVGKAQILRRTLEGDVLFVAMMREPTDGPLREPDTAASKATVATALAAGMPRRTLMGYLAIAVVLLIPLVWRTDARTAALFVLICGTVAWFQMALIEGAGTGAHHTILLWPLLTIGIAAVLGAASRTVKFGPVLFVVVVAAACVSNLLVLSTYYTNLLRNGGPPSWTDAIYPAYDAIHNVDKEAVCTVDWGFRDSLRLLERGRVQLCFTEEPINEVAQRALLLQISRPGYLFLTHTAGSEVVPGMTARLVQFAASKGFRQINYQSFADTNGRKTVEIFQFAPLSH